MAKSYEERVRSAAMTEQPSRLEEAIYEVAAEMRQTEQEMRMLAMKYAISEDAYRKKKAIELLQADGKTIAEKQAHVDLVSSVERVAAHSDEHLKQAVIEISRSQRSRMGALQALLYAAKVEMGLAGRYEGKEMSQRGEVPDGEISL